MKAEEIDKMEAGRDMDALIAERVMGYTVTRVNGEPYTEWHGHKAEPYHLGAYSTDIAAAWQVVEKMREGFKFCCLDLHSDLHYSYTFSLTHYRAEDMHEQEHNPDFVAHAPTAPLAICRAALKAHLALNEPQKPQVSSQQLTELFYSRLTNRGKQVLADEAIRQLEGPQEPEGAGK